MGVSAIRYILPESGQAVIHHSRPLAHGVSTEQQFRKKSEVDHQRRLKVAHSHSRRRHPPPCSHTTRENSPLLEQAGWGSTPADTPTWGTIQGVRGSAGEA
jgi:hypothetical protein